MPSQPSPTLQWDFASGDDIEDACNRGVVLSDLPASEAVYLWRRRSSPPRRALRDGPEFVRWLEEAMLVPGGEIRDQPLGHFATLDRLTLRARALPSDKRRLLVHASREPRHRHFLANYVRTLWQFAPPLYCGETGNLRNRSREHVIGETGFGRRVATGQVPPWRDLELGYLILGDARSADDLSASQRRRLLEVVATSLVVAGYVERRG